MLICPVRFNRSSSLPALLIRHGNWSVKYSGKLKGRTSSCKGKQTLLATNFQSALNYSFFLTFVNAKNTISLDWSRDLFCTNCSTSTLAMPSGLVHSVSQNSLQYFRLTHHGRSTKESTHYWTPWFPWHCRQQTNFLSSLIWRNKSCL